MMCTRAFHYKQKETHGFTHKLYTLCHLDLYPSTDTNCNKQASKTHLPFHEYQTGDPSYTSCIWLPGLHPIGKTKETDIESLFTYSLDTAVNYLMFQEGKETIGKFRKRWLNVVLDDPVPMLEMP